jgi:hypothetical protein
MLETLEHLVAEEAMCDTERTTLVESIAMAESALLAKEQEHTRHKASLASLEEAVVAATANLELKRSEQVAGIETINGAIERKSQLQSLVVETFFPLKAGTVENPVVIADDLVRALTGLGFDASLLRSAQSSLAKAPDTRGDFDARVIEHLSGALEQAGRTYDDLEVNGHVRKAELQTGVDLASATLQATKEARDDGLIAESDSAVEVSTARETLTSLRGDLVAFDRRAAETGLALGLAQQKIDTFRADVLALFGRLRSATCSSSVPSTVDTATLETPVVQQYENVQVSEAEITGESAPEQVEQSASYSPQSKILVQTALVHPVSVHGAALGM